MAPAAPPPSSLGSLTLVGAGSATPSCSRSRRCELLPIVRHGRWGPVREPRNSGTCEGRAARGTGAYQVVRWRSRLASGARRVSGRERGSRLKIDDPFVERPRRRRLLELRALLGVEARVVPGSPRAWPRRLRRACPSPFCGGRSHQTLVSTAYGRGQLVSPELPSTTRAGRSCC